MSIFAANDSQFLADFSFNSDLENEILTRGDADMNPPYGASHGVRVYTIQFGGNNIGLRDNGR